MERSTLNNTLPRGTGPYWYISYIPGVTVRLERNPLWWKQQPHIESVVGRCYYSTAEALEALQTGEIDAFSTRSYTAAFNRRLAALPPRTIPPPAMSFSCPI